MTKPKIFMSDSVELPPSRLGTKAHWDSTYEEELQNFEELGDEGEVWFGVDSVKKIVSWALETIPPNSSPTILEVGSGNGILLFSLAKAGYPASKLCGIDYSPDAIKLASLIAKEREIDDITFGVCDFLSEEPPQPHDIDTGEIPGQWDLLLDKGTYDAIALGPKDESGQSPAAGYPARVARLLRPSGLFLITSCNFTEEELKMIFSAPGLGLRYHSRIQHQTFMFGGKSGSVCSSVAFQKSAENA